MDATTRFEYLVGLHVTDEDGYARYRAGMTPMLIACGGRFRYDLRNGEILQAETSAPINRVFVLSFPSRVVADGFFSDPAYLAVRDEHFDASVGAVTLIAAYERTEDTGRSATSAA